jgi:5-(carboxyamino)imidazole ribonucleotide synthase
VSVVAMVGAGQLARMCHEAALPLGVELRVLAADPEAPAVAAGASCVLGDPGDLDALHALAEGADVVTFDHEQVPPEHLEALERSGVTLAPSAAAKLFAQDKLHMRRGLERLGFAMPPFAEVRSRADVEAFAARHGWPLVGKAPRGGYDGRGVFALPDAAAAEAALEGGPLLVEPRLPIETEVAVMVARSRTGETAAYPVVETVQRDAMCREILAPWPDAGTAAESALAIAEAIGAVGVMAVEYFVVGGELLVNELALRPHNSGHYSIGGCVTSQFEQHVRAVLGWPLGVTDLVAPAVATVNVVGNAHGGEPSDRVPEALGVPGAHVHLYGKAPRPGRKLGHVTVAGTDAEAVAAAARLAAARLEAAA